MIGYKGVVLKNNILRSKYGDIFEVGIPREENSVDDGNAFAECGYSFCGKIEEVIPNEDFFITPEQRIYREVRLFQIDTLDGKIIGSSQHYKTSKIKLIREVTKNEIINYFENNINAKIYVEKYYAKIGDKIEKYEIYRNDISEDYKVIYNKEEIEKICVKSCARFGQNDLCLQSKNEILKLNNCEGCLGNGINLGPKSYERDYLYLIARSKLMDKIALSDIDEYNMLKDNREQNEVRSLELLDEFYK